jgi:hypothetical protein
MQYAVRVFTRDANGHKTKMTITAAGFDEAMALAGAIGTLPNRVAVVVVRLYTIAGVLTIPFSALRKVKEDIEEALGER